jgi:AraC-like DNA-binding protein
MEIERQLLFFFSALGAFNGFFLSIYFAFFLKNKNRATYFFAALTFVISVRVAKSVFLIFYPETSEVFIQVGLTACFLIGPFLFLYVRESKNPTTNTNWNWLWHVLPFVVAMIIIGIYFPYGEFYHLWWRTPPRVFGVSLFISWSVYIVLAIIQARESFKRLMTSEEKITSRDVWILNIVIGNALIWLVYNTTQYTSYIMGAMSFSFLLYISLALWFFRKKKSAVFDVPTKYANKEIDKEQAALINAGLRALMNEREVYKDSNFKLADTAKALDLSPHYLSQYLNDNLGKSFSTFINEYRITAAEEMLKSNNLLTIEAIGNECGFKSNSTFYDAFKKVKGITPAQYKRSIA